MKIDSGLIITNKERGKTMQKVKSNNGMASGEILILGLMVLCLGLSLMGAKNYYLLSGHKSQTETFIPYEAEVYSNINFYPIIWQLKNSKEGNETEEIKVLKKLMSDFQEKNGLNLEEELLSWAEPELSLAMFNTKNFYNFAKARRKLEKCEGNLWKISGALEQYYETNKTYPKELKELVPDYIEALPFCPAGGKYVYTSEKENQIFLLECYEHVHKEAGVTGKYPAYRSEKGIGDVVPYQKEMPEEAYPDYLIAGGIKDRIKAENFISRIQEKSQWKPCTEEYENYKIVSLEKGNLSYCLTEKALLFASNSDIIKKSLQANSGTKKNIQENNLFLKFRDKMPETSMAYTFVNLENILPPLEEDLSKGSWNTISSPALKAFKSYGIVISSNGGGLKIDSYLHLDKASESPIIKILLDKNKEKSGSLKIIPEDSSVIMVSSDLTVMWKTGKEIMAAFPNIQEKYESLKQMVKLFTELDIERDIIENLSGETSISYTFTPEYMKDIKKMNEVEQCEKDLYDITDSVTGYQKANSGAIPEKVEDLVPAYLEKVPRAPGKGNYIIVPIDEKPAGEYPPFYVAYSGDLAIEEIEKNYPRYYSETGYTLGKDEDGNEKSLPLSVPDIIVTLGIKDKEPFKKVVSLFTNYSTELLIKSTYRGISYEGFNNKKNFITSSPLNVSYSFIDNYLVITLGKTKKPMEKAIDTFKGNIKSIQHSRDYKIAMNQISTENLTGVSFMNLKDTTGLVLMFQEDQLKGQVDKIKEFSGYLTSLWSSTCVEEDGIHSSTFIPLNYY